ncbi:hypothetical protein EDD11_003053 [Mortierella claussenii]|nr:hypothetical protein EDD11_003053 [Mortierella claussenii]
MDTKRKIDQSFALLNSLFAHPNKRQSTATPATGCSISSSESTQGNNIPGNHVAATSSVPAVSAITPNKRAYLPPRPAVLDKLSRLSTSRPTLKDSIAASIAASAPATHVGPSEATPQPLTPSTTHTLASELKKSHGRGKKRYLPWSREQFHQRLETFRPSTWFDKPKMVNAVECAKRGWINKGDDRLECCGGCGGVVIVRTNIEQDPTPHEQRTVEDGADTDLGESLDMDAFPEFEFDATRKHVLGRRTLVMTTDQVKGLQGDFSDVKDTRLLILALFGWSAQPEQKALICEACHTRCTYIPAPALDNSSLLSSDHTSASEAMGEANDDTTFDAAQSHRWYCYWVDPEHDPHQKEGWKILYERLVTFRACETNGADSSSQTIAGQTTTRISPDEALIQVRRMLRGQAVLPPASSR